MFFFQPQMPKKFSTRFSSNFWTAQNLERGQLTPSAGLPATTTLQALVDALCFQIVQLRVW